MKKSISLLIGLSALTVSNAQNVGIGTSTPSARLDVKTTSSNYVGQFNGNSPMYMGIYEGDVYRGYLGSYAGNAEDIDFGTGSGTTGKLHLTIQAVPKLTIDNAGKVGIGVTSPAYALDVFGRMRVKTSVLGNSSTGSGIWMDDNRNGNDKIFVGMADSIRFGLWGQSGAGWQFYYDANNGNVGMGTLPATSGARLRVSSVTGNNTADFYNGGNYGGSIKSTDTSLQVFAAYGSNLCFPNPCPTSDLIFNPPSTSIFSYPGNVGFFVNKANADMHIAGNVLIGTTTSTPAAGYKLSIDGKAICTELKVQLSASWPDYVFEDNYSLPSLESIEAKVRTEKHLPGIPSASDVKAQQGIEIGDMQKRMLEKMEEMYLYMFDMSKENKQLKETVTALQKQVAQIQK